MPLSIRYITRRASAACVSRSTQINIWVDEWIHVREESMYIRFPKDDYRQALVAGACPGGAMTHFLPPGSALPRAVPPLSTISVWKKGMRLLPRK